MHNTEDRMAKAVINGEEYELLMTVRAGIKLDKLLSNFGKPKVKPKKNLKNNKNDEAIKNLESDFDVSLKIFNTLHNEALRFRAYEEHKSYKPTTTQDFEFILDVKSMENIKNAIAAAISKSKIVDVPQSTGKN